MAVDQNANYPWFPAKYWWSLQQRFKRSLPTVDAQYLKNVLEVDPSTVSGILSGLRTFGLIDAEGKPTERAERWRHDETYPDVCREILSEVYPTSLQDAAPNPSEDRAPAERWFASVAKGGTSLAKKRVLLYQVVFEADPNKRPDPTKAPPKAANQPRPAPPKKDSPSKKDAASKASSGDSSANGTERLVDEKQKPPENTTPRIQDPAPAAYTPAPAIHFDIQIHIDPGADSKQIDDIFASMAKHLKTLYHTDTK